jgi:hypothetical protein
VLALGHRGKSMVITLALLPLSPFVPHTDP